MRERLPFHVLSTLSLPIAPYPLFLLPCAVSPFLLIADCRMFFCFAFSCSVLPLSALSHPAVPNQCPFCFLLCLTLSPLCLILSLCFLAVSFLPFLPHCFTFSFISTLYCSIIPFLSCSVFRTLPLLASIQYISSLYINMPHN